MMIVIKSADDGRKPILIMVTMYFLGIFSKELYKVISFPNFLFFLQ